jgi:hypothetical protein
MFCGRFQWANFDLMPSGGGSGDADGSRRLRREVGENLSNPYACNIAAEGSVIAAFLERFATISAVLMLVFMARTFCLRLQMWWYPDSPSPPDLALPGWEGPVMVRM